MFVLLVGSKTGGVLSMDGQWESCVFMSVQLSGAIHCICACVVGGWTDLEVHLEEDDDEGPLPP